ncbi:hypothetical protein JCM5350_000269 [Sporobolomyces pararoseus]
MFDSLANWFKCHRTPSPSSQVLASPVSETPTSPTVAPVAADPSGSVDVEGEKGEKQADDAPKEKWFVRCFGGIKKCCGFGKGAGCPCGFGCKSEKKKEVDVVVKEDETKEKKPTEQVEVIEESTTKTTTGEDPFLDNSTAIVPGGGAELTRTETISVNQADEPVMSSSDDKKGTFYEKCKGLFGSSKGGKKENDKK